MRHGTDADPLPQIAIAVVKILVKEKAVKTIILMMMRKIITRTAVLEMIILILILIRV